MKTFIAVLGFGCVALTAMADGYTPHRGSTYIESENLDGSTTTYGVDTQSGNAWSTETETDGSQYGVDSSGDSWSYDKELDTYINHGTGEVCVGGFCN